MRRPLCLLCAAFVVSVFLCMQATELPKVLSGEQEGSRVVYAGEVYHKEYRQDTLLLYLKDTYPVDSTVYSPKEVNSIGILCYLKCAEREPRLGSRVLVSGEASLFRKPRNPGGFDEEMYYRIQNIGFSLKKAELLKESESYSGYHEKLYRLRRYFEKSFDRTMSEKDASIMKAMVLGNKEGLDRDSKRLYQQSGISHILAISGLHISLLGMGLYRWLRRVRLPALPAALLSVVMMILYGDMVGMSSSAYRAIFMFALKMAAEALHRTYDMMTALAMAAVGILAEQPLYIFHAGFLLSFGAIIGIGCMLEVLKTDTKQIYRNKKKQKRSEYLKNLGYYRVREGLLVSGSIFLIHFPIQLSFFYEFPIYSFFLNILILPFLPLVMGFGLVCVITGSAGFGGIAAVISKLAALCCHILLLLFERLCEKALLLPGAVWITGEPSWWRIAVFYGVVCLLFLLHQYAKYIGKGELCFPFPVKMIWILLAVSFLTQQTYQGLSVTMLDVGQGDGIWLETERGRHYLIDGGSSSESRLGEYTLLPFLKQTGTAKIEAVFLTHLDKDHISGIMELLEEKSIRIRSVVLPCAVIRDEVYEELVMKCKAHGAAVVYVKAGDAFTDGSLKITVLHPAADYAAESNNGYSLVMKLEYGGFHALFTGDVEADGERLAAKALPKDWTCHLYKAAHHGSKNSNTEELLNRLSPQLTIISCSEGNRYGHPHTETLERLERAGSRIMITKDSGAIMLHYNPFSDIIEVNSMRKK